MKKILSNLKIRGVRRALLTLTLPLFLAAGAGTTSAELITIGFTAQIDRKSASGSLPGLVAVGDVISGTYTYDSTAPDTRPTRPESGFYNAVADLNLDLNGASLTGSSGAMSIFLSSSRLPDNYVVVGNLDGGLRLELQVGAPAGTFADDSLPTAAPDLSGVFFSREFKITGDGAIFGHVLSLELVDEAPVVACGVAEGVLWSPNHKLVDVGLGVDVLDDTDSDLAVEALIYCNESAAGDAVVAGEGLALRAEREGRKRGRVYLIIVAATDAAGNVGYDCCTVVVPHDKSKKSVGSVLIEAAEAEQYCIDNGAVPPGFTLAGGSQ